MKYEYNLKTIYTKKIEKLLNQSQIKLMDITLPFQNVDAISIIGNIVYANGNNFENYFYYDENKKYISEDTFNKMNNIKDSIQVLKNHLGYENSKEIYELTKELKTIELNDLDDISITYFTFTRENLLNYSVNEQTDFIPYTIQLDTYESDVFSKNIDKAYTLNHYPDNHSFILAVCTSHIESYELNALQDLLVEVFTIYNEWVAKEYSF